MSRILRSNEYKRGVIDNDGAIVLLSMMDTHAEDRVSLFDSHPEARNDSELVRTIQRGLKLGSADYNSLDGVFFDVLRPLRGHGPRIYNRARRSYSMRPSPMLDRITETPESGSSAGSFANVMLVVDQQVKVVQRRVTKSSFSALVKVAASPADSTNTFSMKVSF